MLKRRLARLVLVGGLLAGTTILGAACNGATAGNGQISPPSSTGK